MRKRISENISEYSYDDKKDLDYNQTQHIEAEDYQIVEEEILNLKKSSLPSIEVQKRIKIGLRKRNQSQTNNAFKLNTNVKRLKQNTYTGQLTPKDKIDIIIAILLVIVLGVTLFRVILQVQIQFQNKKDSQVSTQIDIEKDRKIQQKNNLLNKAKNTQTIAQLQIQPECKTYLSQRLKQRGSLYDFNIPFQYFRSKSRVQTYKENKKSNINKEQYSEAIDLLGINHHIDENGKLLLNPDPCESEQTKFNRFKQAMENQAKRLNTKYQIDSYFNRQIPFCLVVNSYNNAQNGLIYRNIDSILQQNYTNYHVVFTDDNSLDLTGKKAKQYLSEKGIPQNKFRILINQNKKGMMQNIYNAIHQYCQDGQVTVMVDGDDSLIGTNVLMLLNAVYQKEKLALLWSNFISINSNSAANIGFCMDFNEAQKKQSAFRKSKMFISSHLKTFFVDLFKKIKPADLKYNDQSFFGGASDTAMMIPMIQMANPRIKYLNQILYEYRFDTGQTGNSVNRIPQREALKKIFSSQAYNKLSDFSFVQRAINNPLLITKKAI